MYISIYAHINICIYLYMHIFHFYKWRYTGLYEAYMRISIYEYTNIFIYQYMRILIYEYMHIFKNEIPEKSYCINVCEAL